MRVNTIVIFGVGVIQKIERTDVAPPYPTLISNQTHPSCVGVVGWGGIGLIRLLSLKDYHIIIGECGSDEEEERVTSFSLPPFYPLPS
jgi:hypothetical protein